MKLLVLLVSWTILVPLGQATGGASLQRGTLSRQLVEAIARMPHLHSEYVAWDKKQQWFQSPNASSKPELGELLSQLGVSGEAFLLATKQFSEIYPAFWDFRWKGERGGRISEDDLLPVQIFHELAVDKSMANKKELELFTRLLEEPQTLITKSKRRIALLTEIATHGQDPIYDSAYSPSEFRSNLLRANRIGLNWETYMRIISDDPVSLADFVYMRYAVGEDKKANDLFNALLAECGLNRAEFDDFFAANKDDYADLSKRKNIMDKILNMVLTPTLAQDQRKSGSVMYDKLGINESIYIGYVYAGYDLQLWALARAEQSFGGEEKLRPALDALLADNGMPRAEFEQVFDEVKSVYSIFFPHHHGGREMEREHLLGQFAGGFSPTANYFESLLTKAGNVAAPEQARRRAAILQQMLATQEPTQAYFHTRVEQLGIRDSDHVLFAFIVAGINDVNDVNERKYSYLDELVNMRHAIGKDQQLNALFNDLLVEYNLSHAEFDEFFVANKDKYVGFHWPPTAMPFREKLAAAKE